MNFIFQMKPGMHESLGPLRVMAGLEICVTEQLTWLRYTGDQLPAAIRQLAVSAAFELRENLLFPPGKVTPVGEMPVLSWQSIASALVVELPVSALPGTRPVSTLLQLKHSVTEQKPDAMLVTLSTWKEYGETASQVRLNRLRFAVSSEGQVLVLGEPLPSVPGNSYYTVKNFLVPAGMEFEFPIAPFMDRIKDLFPPDSMILFDTGSTWTAIPENYFVPARRSSIRQTNTSRLHD